MSLVDLASFPNSRIKPRPATQLSFENNVAILANTPTLIRPAQSNRTNLTLYNNSLTAVFYYKCGDDINIQTEGFPVGPNRAVDLDSPQAIYVWSPDALVISYDDSVG